MLHGLGETLHGDADAISGSHRSPEGQHVLDEFGDERAQNRPKQCEHLRVGLPVLVSRDFPLPFVAELRKHPGLQFIPIVAGGFLGFFLGGTQLPFCSAQLRLHRLLGLCSDADLLDPQVADRLSPEIGPHLAERRVIPRGEEVPVEPLEPEIDFLEEPIDIAAGDGRAAGMMAAGNRPARVAEFLTHPRVESRVDRRLVGCGWILEKFVHRRIQFVELVAAVEPAERIAECGLIRVLLPRLRVERHGDGGIRRGHRRRVSREGAASPTASSQLRAGRGIFGTSHQCLRI